MGDRRERSDRRGRPGEPAGRDPHVLDDALDHVEGRLPPHRLESVEAHLAACGECRAHYAFVADLAHDTRQAGVRHLRPERIVTLAERAIDGERLLPEEQAHLDICAACAQDLDWAEHAPPLPAPGPARPRETPALRAVLGRLRTRWAMGLGVAAASVAVLLVLLMPASVDVRDLARIEPLPSPQVTRGSETDAPILEALSRASECYEAGRYDEAARAFGEAARISPRRADIQLYLGSSLLLAGKPHEASDALRAAVASAPAEVAAVQDEALWQLAQAYLALGDGDEAESCLRRIERLDLARKGQARALLDALDRR